jgi:hypothetical protein
MNVISFLASGGYVVLGTWTPQECWREDSDLMIFPPAYAPAPGYPLLPECLANAARQPMRYLVTWIHHKFGGREPAVEDRPGRPLPEWLPGWRPARDYEALREMVHRARG